MSLSQTIEPLSFRALPALEQHDYDGWIIRYAKGYTKRANSVNPVYGSTSDISQKIAYCESYYAGKNCRTVFKLTDDAHPAGLDAILADRGYRKEATTHVYSLSLDEKWETSPNIQIETALDDRWVKSFFALNTIPDQHADTLYQMLSQIEPDCAYLSLYHENSVVGVALGVFDAGWIGVFDVVVDHRFRGRGYGRQIINALLNWGKNHGATHSYLQVQADNIAATRLYQSMGYTPQYDYWYRIRDL